jgi:hypothetical protein
MKDSSKKEDKHGKEGGSIGNTRRILGLSKNTQEVLVGSHRIPSNRLRCIDPFDGRVRSRPIHLYVVLIRCRWKKKQE